MASADDNGTGDDGNNLFRIHMKELDLAKPTTEEPAADNVVSATFGQETTVKEWYHEHRYCRHLNIEVSGQARTVTCTVCKALLDPFERLLQYARKERDWIHAQAKEREVEARIELLLKEEKRIKARTRNASRKDAEVAIEAERKLRREKNQRTRRNARQIVELAQRIERAMLDQPEPDAILPVDEEYEARVDEAIALRRAGTKDESEAP